MNNTENREKEKEKSSATTIDSVSTEKHIFPLDIGWISSTRAAFHYSLRF